MPNDASTWVKTDGDDSSAWKLFIERSHYFDLIDHFKGNDLLISNILALKPKTVVEVGVGCGLTSVALAQKGIQVTVVDNNQDVLDSVRKVADFYGVTLSYVKNDAKRWKLRDDLVQSENIRMRMHGCYDVVYSQGLLEHFSDEDIQLILNRMFAFSRTMIFEVPTKNWLSASSSTSVFGDERFLSFKDWKRLTKPFQVLRTYGWGLLPKYRLLQVGLPYFLLKRIAPFIANNIGFVIKGNGGIFE